MELPNIGGNCQWAGCNALDFLPFTCSFCSGAFCLAHFQVDSHECQNVAVAKPFEGRSGSKNSVCSLDGCITTDVVQMLCVKCHLHFCLKHRYHGCFKYSEEDIEEARRKINVPREQFAESLQKVSVRVSTLWALTSYYSLCWMYVSRDQNVEFYVKILTEIATV